MLQLFSSLFLLKENLIYIPGVTIATAFSRWMYANPLPCHIQMKYLKHWLLLTRKHAEKFNQSTATLKSQKT